MPPRAKVPPPPQHPVYEDDDALLEGGEEEEDFDQDDEVEEDEVEEEEEPAPKKHKGGVKVKGKPKPKPKPMHTTTAKGKPKLKPKPNATTRVIKKASGPGAKPPPGAKKEGLIAAKRSANRSKSSPKKPAPAPESPDDRRPSVNFKDAMQKYQNSPTRKLQKVKSEQLAAVEEEAAKCGNPQAIQRKLWNRFDRSLQQATQRQSRAPKAPARIRDAIMSAPDGGTRIDFFKLYCECGGDWGKVEAKHKKRESAREGSGSRRRWLMLSQMAKLYESMEVALAMKQICLEEDGCHRQHPKLKQDIKPAPDVWRTVLSCRPAILPSCIGHRRENFKNWKSRRRKFEKLEVATEKIKKKLEVATEKI